MKIGDKVYINLSRYSRIKVEEGAIIKIHRNGRFVVQLDNGNKYEFTEKGVEVSSEKWNKAYIISESSYKMMVVDMERQKRMAGVKLQLEKVNACSVNNKEQFIENVRSLLKLAEGL